MLVPSARQALLVGGTGKGCVWVAGRKGHLCGRGYQNSVEIALVPRLFRRSRWDQACAEAKDGGPGPGKGLLEGRRMSDGWGAYAVEITSQEEGSGPAARVSGKGKGESSEPQGWRWRCPGPTFFHLLQSCCSGGEEGKWGDAQGLLSRYG